MGFAALQDGLDAQQQFLDGERFGEVIIGPESETGHTVLGLGAGGEHDDRGAQSERIETQCLEDTHAVHAGQIQVQQDEFGTAGSG